MKKSLLTLITISCIGCGAMAQNVNIPDANFKAYLVGNTLVNTNSDTEIQVSEASAFTGDFYTNNLNITDLTGLEAFTSLNALYVRNNNLGTLDISANTALTYLDCQNTNITSLDLSNNTALAGIDCSINSITSLDFSNNPAMAAINCGNNSLTSLNVSNNPLLSNFSCDNNDLTTLDVSNNTALLYFVCHFNEFTNIDVSNNTAMTYFSCSGNNLTSLDLSNNNLYSLYCAVNSIEHLDLSTHTNLVLLRCDDNNLSTLNVANGNNTNFTLFNASSNNNLTCIQVDDASYSTTNWTSIDASASFSTNCNYNIGLDEVNLSESLTIYPNPSSFQLHVDLNTPIVSMHIIDAVGNTIEARTSVANTVDISALANGIYVLQVETVNGMATTKFIKN